MTATTSTARDEIQGAFLQAWKAHAPAAAGTALPPRVFWDAVEESEGPRTDECWARVTVAHNPPAGGQKTFAPRGGRRFARAGIVTVQVFTPLSLENCITVSEALAIVARNAYEGEQTPSGVWFRNAGIQEVGPDGPWFQLNATAEFSYDEIK